MTLREFFDSFTSSPAAVFFPVSLPSATADRGSIEVRIDNPNGVPAHYTVARLRRSGRPLTKIDASDRRVGVPTRRTLRLPLTESSVAADHLITIRAAGRTSKLVLYRESLATSVDGAAADVSVSIAPTGAVRFSVSRPRRPAVS